jgi:hypothetical protein
MTLTLALTYNLIGAAPAVLTLSGLPVRATIASLPGSGTITWTSSAQGDLSHH